MSDLKKFFSVGMGILAASLGPRFVYKTGIVFPEKGTRRLLKNHEVIFVSPKILPDKIKLFHF